MKLILVHFWGGEPCGGTSIIPFEYESKEKFVFDVLEKYKNKEWMVGTHGIFEEVEIFPNAYLNKWDIEEIEHNVYELNEWFDKQKTKYEN